MEQRGFELDEYLPRVGYSGPIRATVDAFESINRAQNYTIPFENFDILLGRGISLEPEALFNKLIRSNRGGYCFEQNGLFLMALHAFGFVARPLLARVHISGTPSGRSHQISLVTLNGRQWIADVGFGRQGLRMPIPLEFGEPTNHDGHMVRLIEFEEFGVMLQSKEDDEWQNLYSFDLEYVHKSDIEQGNYFTSTNPNSFFTFARVATLANPEGATTLFNRTLRKIDKDSDKELELDEGPAYIDALKTNFGIELDAPYEAIRPLNP